MIFKTIDNYELLGRFIIDQTYAILLHNHHTYDYRHLKNEIQNIIQIYPFVDKSFAMYEYNHGNAKYHFCKYRWENVMDYYIKQQCRALFLQHITNPFGNIDNINLIEPYNHTLLKEKDLSFMVDKARTNIKQREEEYLLKAKTNPKAEQDLVAQGILGYRNQRIAMQKRYEEYVCSKKRQ